MDNPRRGRPCACPVGSWGNHIPGNRIEGNHKGCPYVSVIRCATRTLGNHKGCPYEDR